MKENKKEQDFGDFMFQQATAISKAHAYDIVSKDAAKYRKALEEIVGLKKEPGMSQPYIDKILEIAKEALIIKLE